MKMTRKTLPLAIAALISPMAMGEDSTVPVEEMVITTVRMSEPLRVVTDPRQPRQPLPAHDGADYLKTIPGFSVVRKGGADGDPIFRGMAGSRLSLLVDGETVLGGCGHRMDPPTAYIFPESFDSIEVIKGPQSVQHGPGNAAGVVRFERNRAPVTESGWDVHASALGASFGRHDEVIDATYKNPRFQLRGTATNASQNDYRDGDGTRIHSSYNRRSAQVSAAWTPDQDSFLELSGGVSDGEAAYADRGMDGSLFDREHLGLKASFDNISPLINKIDTQVYYQYIDHVMDNYSLRSLPEGAKQRAMNPDRETLGGRLATTLRTSAELEWVLGLDVQHNEHSNRGSMNQMMMPYQQMTRQTDAQFRQNGLFAESSWDFRPDQSIKAGLRADHWTARDQRQQVALGMMDSAPNPSAGQSRSDTLYSAFLRHEMQLEALPAMLYAGLGHNERFPDYWEMINKESVDSLSAFNIESEKVTQLDVGLVYSHNRINGSFSLFYNEINDFILIDSTVMKPTMGGMMGMNMRSATVARSIDARSYGAEADVTLALADNWRTEMTLASVRGRNKTDDRALPQLPPLEATVGLHYDDRRWSFGGMVRAIAAQNHVDPGRGNIAGQDIDITGSATVLSLNAGWRPSEALLFTAGIDNALDHSYAEHVSRAGASIPGFDQTQRVNEPGRTLWLKAQFTF